MLELLITIAILGILGSGVMIIIGRNSPAKARDAIRKADIKNIAGAVNAYYFSNNNSFPPPTAGNVFTSSAGGEWIPGLTKEMKTIPVDPKQAGVFVYLAGLIKAIFLETFQDTSIDIAAQSGSFPYVCPTCTATSLETSSVTSHDVSLPSGIVSGDLLIVKFTTSGGDGSTTITWPPGWTQFFNVAVENGTRVRLAAAYRQADGTEGATIIVTTSRSGDSAHHAYRISGAENPAVQPPQASAGATGNSNSPDPDSLTPTGGAKDYLWLAISGHDDGNDGYILPAPTTNYTNLLANESSGAAGVSAGSARRELNAASQDPGAFTLDDTNTHYWVAATIAVYPAPPPPTADIDANTEDGPIEVTSGTDVTLSWSSTDTGCLVTPGNWSIGDTPQIVNITSDVIYNLDCDTASDSVTINISAGGGGEGAAICPYRYETTTDRQDFILWGCLELFYDEHVFNINNPGDPNNARAPCPKTASWKAPAYLETLKEADSRYNYNFCIESR